MTIIIEIPASKKRTALCTVGNDLQFYYINVVSIFM